MTAPARSVTLSYSGKVPAHLILEETQEARLGLIDVIGDGSGTPFNRLIQGDNLGVMKTLRSQFCNKIQLIVIDPPFGSGRKWWQCHKGSVNLAFDDQLAGAKYLEWLRKRLVFLRELLAKEGSLWVHSSNRSAPYLKIILEEIFGVRWSSTVHCLETDGRSSQFEVVSHYPRFYFLLSQVQTLLFSSGNGSCRFFRIKSPISICRCCRSPVCNWRTDGPGSENGN